MGEMSTTKSTLPDHHLSEEIYAEGTRINGLYDEARQLEDAAAKRTRLFNEKLSRLEEELRRTILEATENSNMYEVRIRTLDEEAGNLKALLRTSERQSSDLAGENAKLKEEITELKMKTESFDRKASEYRTEVESMIKLSEHDKARCKDLEMQITDLEDLRAGERSRDLARIRELERGLEAAQRKADELKERLNEPRYTEGPDFGVQADLPDVEMVGECERLKSLLRRVSEGGYADGSLGGVPCNRSGVCELRLPIDWSSRPYAVEVEVSVDKDRWSAAGMLQLGDGSEKGCSPTDGDVPLELLMIVDRTGEEVVGQFLMSLSDRGLFTIGLERNNRGWDLRVRLRYGSRVPQLERLLKNAQEENSMLLADVAKLRDLENALESARAERSLLVGERDSAREELRAAKTALAAERDAKRRLEEGGAELVPKEPSRFEIDVMFDQEATTKSRVEEERRRGDSLQREVDRLRHSQQDPYRRESGQAERRDGQYQSRVSKSLMGGEEVDVFRRSDTTHPEGHRGRMTDNRHNLPATAPDLAALLASTRDRATRAEMEVAELQAVVEGRGVSGLTPMLDGERRRGDQAEREVLRLKEEIRRRQEYGRDSEALMRRAERAEEEVRRLRWELDRCQQAEVSDSVYTENAEMEIRRLREEYATLMHREQLSAEWTEEEIRRLRDELEAFEQGHNPDLARIIDQERARAARAEAEVRRLREELRRSGSAHVSVELRGAPDQPRSPSPDLLELEKERRRAQQAEAECPDIVPALDAERRRAERAEREVLQLMEDLRVAQTMSADGLRVLRGRYVASNENSVNYDVSLQNLGLSSDQSSDFDMVLHLQQHIQVLRNDLDRALRDRYETSRAPLPA
ncbi:Paramyosin, putative [Perkinsus marinus ATCC 50983]|uniref:Paramyosin, putative n=1 Tax=Perkinsus marinus (strain ATCC 50983 / TXsc) TaxID=423536 RepID=C5K4C9_PERM5|nr:Paramyosin, putative [Perkinsus marinus ATCC 50983]EER20622.1 Paramyosin, putative [Perkinsus marinus ATCC 50983]|eukprot:XP_002788826.1 Paramyosin, putative [Perkinsus marinus ATCC 50983]